nr:HAD hydrolase-like protein [Desulfobulbaceae bacterium]
MPDLKLVIFDCDGVMFDSKNANLEYYNHILARFGHPPMSDEELDYVHAHHVEDSVRQIYRNYPDDYRKADEYRKQLDYTPYLRHMLIESDLIEFLRFLKPRFNTAISTNRSSTMKTVLDMFNLAEHFQMVVTALDVDNPKPHPEALHKILAHFKCTVEESIYIGDSQIDRQHTEAVGMRMIAFKNQALAAEFHVSSFMEIVTLGILR